MTFEETRDNTTAIENLIIEGDAREDAEDTEGIRRSKPFMDDYLPEQEEPEDMTPPDPNDPKYDALFAADTDYEIPVLRDDIDSEDSDGPADVRRVVFTGFSSVDPDDPDDPEHDELGDAETEYDIEYDDEPEDDGQPSEYEEWQDFMGGDEHYDHSENEMW